MTEPSSQSSALINCMNRVQSIPASQLRFADFVQPALGHHGIYAFFAGDEYQVTDERTDERIDCWYIGSATSKAMVECVASHFVPCSQCRDSLLRQIAYTVARPEDKMLFSEKNPTEEQKVRIEEIMEQCLPIMQSLRLRFILYDEPVNEDLSDAIHADEQTLINHFRPAFNNLKESGLELLTSTSNDDNTNQIKNLKTTIMDEKEKMTFEMAKQLHEQYAASDNAKATNVIGFLSAIAFVFVGFGCVYVQPYLNDFDGNGYVKLLYSVDFLANAIIVMISFLCVNFGYSTRRDHVVITRLRKQYAEKESSLWFNDKYKGTHKKLNNYLPDYYFITFCFLQLFVIALFFGCIMNIKVDDSTIFCIIGALAIILNLSYYCYCHKKYQGFLTDTEKEDKTKNIKK